MMAADDPETWRARSSSSTIVWTKVIRNITALAPREQLLSKNNPKRKSHIDGMNARKT